MAVAGAVALVAGVICVRGDGLGQSVLMIRADARLKMMQETGAIPAVDSSIINRTHYH
jgi:hypothetical protein